MRDEEFIKYFLENLPDNLYAAISKLCHRFLEKHLEKALSYEQYLRAFYIFKNFLDEHKVLYSIPKSLEEENPYQIVQGIGEFFTKTQKNMQSLHLVEQFSNKKLNRLWQQKYENQSTKASEYQSKDVLTMDKIKILFLAADPSDSVRLRLGQELRDIREKLQLSKQRDNFSLESRESVRTGDITQAIFDVEPQVVHFSGHGINTGELCFEDVLGRAQPVQPDALANLFELVTEQVNCVVLNACYSKDQAAAISRHIPCVIGMNQAIGDNTAIAFAVGFYRALGAGRSFEDAYKFARVEIQLHDIPEYLTPLLFHKDT